MQQEDGVVIFGIKPESYFTPERLAELRNFAGWEFYGINHFSGTTVCGVVKKLKVRADSPVAELDFEWLSAYREKYGHWVGMRPKWQDINLAKYDGAMPAGSNVAFFSHVEKLQGKPSKELCLYPRGFFEASDQSFAWGLVKAASRYNDGWNLRKKHSSRDRKTLLCG